ncbi:NUDIX domain-containing protein [Nocardia gipuzkoensis]
MERIPLRDDKEGIPCPNMWALLGGYREEGESSQECAIREIKEEIGVVLDPELVVHHCTRDRHWGLREHTFKTVRDIDIDQVTLTEGQRLKWFTEAEIAETVLGFEENEMMAAYFAAIRSQQDPIG